MRFMGCDGRTYSFNELQNPSMFNNIKGDYFEGYEDKPEYPCIISKFGVNLKQGNLCLHDIKRVRDAGFSVLVQENEPLLKGVFV